MAFSMTVWLSIPCVVVGRGCCMGALAPAAFVSSHTDTMDGMSIPIAALSTFVHRPVLTPKASPLWFILWSSDGFMAIGTRIDICSYLWARPYA